MKRGPKPGSHQQNGRVHDGYSVTGSNDGGWSFVEGIPDKPLLISHGETKAFRDCIRRRGIKFDIRLF